MLLSGSYYPVHICLLPWKKSGIFSRGAEADVRRLAHIDMVLNVAASQIPKNVSPSVYAVLYYDYCIRKIFIVLDSRSANNNIIIIFKILTLLNFGTVLWRDPYIWQSVQRFFVDENNSVACNKYQQLLVFAISNNWIQTNLSCVRKTQLTSHHYSQYGWCCYLKHLIMSLKFKSVLKCF